MKSVWPYFKRREVAHEDLRRCSNSVWKLYIEEYNLSSCRRSQLLGSAFGWNWEKLWVAHPFTSQPPLPPPSHLSVDWRSGIILETPSRGSFLSIKRKMQLRRLWGDRKDLLRAPLPPTSDARPRLRRHQVSWTAAAQYRINYLVDRGTSGGRGEFPQSALPTCRRDPRPEAAVETLRVVASRRSLGCRCVEKEREDRWLRWRYKGLTTFCTHFYRFVAKSFVSFCSYASKFRHNYPRSLWWWKRTPPYLVRNEWICLIRHLVVIVKVIFTYWDSFKVDLKNIYN